MVILPCFIACCMLAYNSQNVSTKTTVNMGKLRNRGIGMSKISFMLFLQKGREGRERTIADGPSSKLHLTHFATTIKFSLLKYDSFKKHMGTCRII